MSLRHYSKVNKSSTKQNVRSQPKNQNGESEKTLRQSIVLGPRCVPEKVGVNQKDVDEK